MHLVLCGQCSGYAAQLQKIAVWARRLVSEKEVAAEAEIRKVEDAVIDRESGS
jgi:hypothetical protein